MPRGTGSLTSLFKIKAYPLERESNNQWLIAPRRSPEFIQLDINKIATMPFEFVTATRGGKKLDLIKINLDGQDYGIDRSVYSATEIPLMKAIFGLK